MNESPYRTPPNEPVRCWCNFCCEDGKHEASNTAFGKEKHLFCTGCLANCTVSGSSQKEYHTFVAQQITAHAQTSIAHSLRRLVELVDKLLSTVVR